MKGRYWIFSAWAYVKHRLTSRHTLGHGIHSPYLFYIARAILPDTNSYYCFGAIERARGDLLLSHEKIDVVDYGTGQSGRRGVAVIAASSLKPRQEAQILFRLAVMTGAKEMVELGTSLGVTSAYLAAASSVARVTTFEGSPAIAGVAKNVWKKLHLKNIDCRIGNLDEVLAKYAPSCPIDLAFLDANHTGDATLRYFEYLQQYAAETTIFVLDDIHYSPDMQHAWEVICKHPSVTATMDLFSMGLVFFDKHLERKTYRIRL